jgi:hypothetical protein
MRARATGEGGSQRTCQRSSAGAQHTLLQPTCSSVGCTRCTRSSALPTFCSILPPLRAHFRPVFALTSPPSHSRFPPLRRLPRLLYNRGHARPLGLPTFTSFTSLIYAEACDITLSTSILPPSFYSPGIPETTQSTLATRIISQDYPTTPGLPRTCFLSSHLTTTYCPRNFPRIFKSQKERKTSTSTFVTSQSATVLRYYQFSLVLLLFFSAFLVILQGPGPGHALSP